jgi:hypothetical protein
MIHRQLWVSYIATTAQSIITASIAYRATDITSAIQAQGGLTGALFRHEHLLYGYLESTRPIDLHALWDALLGDLLISMPSVQGTRVAIELPDIYHDGMPGDSPLWRTPEYTPQKRVGSSPASNLTCTAVMSTIIFCAKKTSPRIQQILHHRRPRISDFFVPRMASNGR